MEAGVRAEVGREGDRPCLGLLDGWVDPPLVACFPSERVPGFASVARLVQFEYRGQGDGDALRAQLERVVPQLLDCVDGKLDRGETAEIYVGESFLDPGGTVQPGRIGVFAPDMELLDCNKDAMASWKFTMASAGTISWTVEFAPGA